MPMYALRVEKRRVQQIVTFVEADDVGEAKMKWANGDRGPEFPLGESYGHNVVMAADEATHDRLCFCPYCVPEMNDDDGD